MMKVILTAAIVFSLVCVGASAQTATGRVDKRARVDNCRPIGKTTDGQLIYPLECEEILTRGPTEARVDHRARASERPNISGGGLFGFSSPSERDDAPRGPSVPPSPN